MKAMTAATLEPMAPSDGVAETTAATVAEKAAAAQESLGQRMVNGVKGFVSGVWDGVCRFFGWLKNKVVAAARWVRDKAVSAYEWVRDRIVKPGARWVRDNAGKIKDKAIDWAKRAWSWSKSTVRKCWSWIKAGAARTWKWAAPFRSWIATPFRSVLGAGIGITALLLLGGQVMMVAALPVALLFLLLGRNEKAKGERLQSSDADVIIIEDEDKLELNEAQLKALDVRISHVSDENVKFLDKGDKNMSSEYFGRLYILTQRVGGSGATVPKLKKEFKAAQLSKYGQAKAHESFTWNAAERGIEDEDKVIAKLLAANAGKVGFTSPVS
jgi:hypothetical protein